MPASHEALGYLVGLLGRLLAQSLKVRNGPGGVLPGQFPVALALLAAGRRVTQKELCERVRIEQGTMAATLKRMERDGVIRRQIDDADQRQSFVSLSEIGRSLTETAVANAREVNVAAVEGLSVAQVALLREGVTLMIANLERDLGRLRDVDASEVRPSPIDKKESFA